jgi:murein DD-endopeptidase MepM/ murein hydrolase activator NlpD
MPARLVYAPKAYVFTKDQSGATHDLSPWVTAGQVRRVINQVSSAEVTLRNPMKRFTTPSSGVAFHPMDPITIYLERLAGFPVRVFTGYLDNTPYYQMYPGVITLQASCTLKRLQYTYFDPALPFITAFFAQYGWENTGQGSVFNFNALGHPTPISEANLQDSSIGKLIWATLFEIGDWQDTNIYVENLPPGIAQRMATLMNSLAQEQQTAQQEITDFMKQIIGTSPQGSAPGSPSSPNITTGNVQNLPQIVYTMTQTANSYGLPPTFVVATWLAEGSVTNDSPNFAGARGYFQWTSSQPYSELPPVTGYPQSAADLGYATDIFCKAAKIVLTRNPSFSAQSNWETWAETVQQPGMGAYASYWAADVQKAQGYVSQYGSTPPSIGLHTSTTGPRPLTPTATSIKHAHNPPAQPSPPSSSNQFLLPFAKSQCPAPSSWSVDQGVDIPASANTPEHAVLSGTVVGHGISGFGPWCPILKLDTPVQGNEAVYYGHAGPSGLAAIGTHLNAGDQIASVGPGIVGISTGPHLEIGFCSAAGQPGPNGGPQAQLMHSLLTTAFNNGSAPAPGPGSPTPTTGPGSPGATTNTNTAQAFVAELNFPTIEDMVVATALGSEHKGLMHDQSLLPFIQELCTASLRSFQSLPNGDFYAFYPDYFGEFGHHPPYWLIDDIEILDGGINLSDDALATHVYVVGDNTWAVNSPDNTLLNMLFSAGDINIFNAFIDPSIIDTSTSSSATPPPKTTSKTTPANILESSEAVSFIERYGARPLVLNVPQVRSSIFEMLLAYQQFMLAWSNQFLTPFTFTFMPEIFPGGKVGFPNHGIQMYVNSVTHTWDYAEGGFQTQAEMMAPSLLQGVDAANFPDLPPNMIRALAEPLQKGPPGSASTSQTAKQKAQVTTSTNQFYQDLAQSLNDPSVTSQDPFSGPGHRG